MVYAFDVRPEVAEQIESMGAEFVFLDFEQEQSDGAETGGYLLHQVLNLERNSLPNFES